MIMVADAGEVGVRRQGNEGERRSWCTISSCAHTLRGKSLGKPLIYLWDGGSCLGIEVEDALAIAEETEV
jgi:hypothetical protein